MAGISMEVVGLDALIAELAHLEISTQQKAEQAVTDATLDARDASLPLIPVRTGFMKSRQQVRVTGGGGAGLLMNELYNDAPYSRWACMGHHSRSGSWVPGQDFMTAPMMVGQKSLESRLGRIFG